MSERDEFEKWYVSMFFVKPSEGLKLISDRNMFRAWQAARAQGGQGAKPIGFTWDAGRFGRQFTADAGVADRVRVDGVAVSPVYTQPQPAVPASIAKAAKAIKEAYEEGFEDGMEMYRSDFEDRWNESQAKVAYESLLSTTRQADGWIRCEDRLPAEADADCFSQVWFCRDPDAEPGSINGLGLSMFYAVMENAEDYLKNWPDAYWAPTGLKRPQPPKQEGDA